MTCGIAFDNLADLARVTASSAAATLPASFVQTVHVAQPWRSIGTPA